MTTTAAERKELCVAMREMRLQDRFEERQTQLLINQELKMNYLGEILEGLDLEILEENLKSLGKNEKRKKKRI